MSGLQRARLRQRPRRAAHPGREHVRRLHRQRSEGVDLDRPPRHALHAAGPHQRRRAEACRHLGSARADGLARAQPAPDQADERRGGVRRAVLRRRVRAEERAARPARRGLAGHDGHTRLRASRRDLDRRQARRRGDDVDELTGRGARQRPDASPCARRLHRGADTAVDGPAGAGEHQRPRRGRRCVVADQAELVGAVEARSPRSGPTWPAPASWPVSTPTRNMRCSPADQRPSPAARQK